MIKLSKSMAKPIHLTRISLPFLRPNSIFFLFARTETKSSILLPSIILQKPLSISTNPVAPSHLFSTTATPYPLQYEMIISRPANSSPPKTRRRPRHTQLAKSQPTDSEPDSELGFDDWVDKKLTANQSPNLNSPDMDKSKRKYYNKRMKIMYGSDSEEDSNRENNDNFVELKPEVVELRTLHKKEEELYFYDTFAYPWEKEKHYRMVYQLEEKYFPDQCFDKAFPEHGESNNNAKNKRVKEGVGKKDAGLVFFEEENSVKESDNGLQKDAKTDVTEKKVEEFFKCLKKVPNKDSETAGAEPFVAARSNGLPPKWDSPTGIVVLVNKPKGWTSFTVCGKLRRLVKVKKVIQREPWEHIKVEDLKKTAASFCGEIWQVPPMFSAIKVGGEKMYDKARRGESIELSPRRISIFQFDVERSLDDRPIFS